MKKNSHRIDYMKPVLPFPFFLAMRPDRTVTVLSVLVTKDHVSVFRTP